MNRMRSTLAAAVVVSLFACSDANGPDASFGKGSKGSNNQQSGENQGEDFASCRPRAERVDTFTVDGKGGKFKVDYAQLDVPKNALPSGTPRTFEMRTPSATFNSVIFTPVDGQGSMTFTAPVNLRLKYDNCSGDFKQKHMVYTTDDVDPATGYPTVLSVVGHDDDFFTSSVGGHTDHFSRYAVSY